MSLRHPFRLVILVLALGVAASELRGAPADPSGFVGELVNQALAALSNKQMGQEERTKHFRELLDHDFDMPRISRFVLGRYWNDANDQDKQQFLRLFEEYVVRSYAQRFSQYSGEQVKILGARPESETSTLVQSQILRLNGAPPAKVDWRVRKGESGFKIVDVDVEGVSMIVTQREEFSSVIQRSGGVAGLNKTLQEKLAAGDTSLASPPLPKNQ